MSLIVDNRAALAGKPGVHVFIAGVSEYPALAPIGAPAAAAAFGMTRLTGTCLAAVQFLEWLERRDAAGKLAGKLASVRLLLTPAPDEPLPAPLSGVERCTLLNFLNTAAEWRTDASTHRDNLTIFYFAGHGIQITKGKAVLLMEEFGSLPPALNQLTFSIDIQNLFQGMSPALGRNEMARTQLYFVDACRNHPSQLNQFAPAGATEVFKEELGGTDDRCAPIFMAVPDSRFYAIPGKGTVFCKNLLDCLDNSAGVPGPDVDSNGDTIWQVSVHSLSEALTARFATLPAAEKADQDITVGGLVENAVIQSLDGAPQVPLLLQCDPEGADPHAKVVVKDAADQSVLELPPPTLPFSGTLQGGIYAVEATFDPPHDATFRRWRQFVNVSPPQSTRRMKVG